jgi:hypothetical protein
VGDKLVAVFTGGELAAILATCKGGGFQSRRDYAVMSLFKDAGVRLSELSGLHLQADIRAAHPACHRKPGAWSCSLDSVRAASLARSADCVAMVSDRPV